MVKSEIIILHRVKTSGRKALNLKFNEGENMSDDKKKLLIINPGSTSTKVSLFLDEECLFEKNLFHDAPELLKYKHVNDQLPFRCGVILNMLAEENVDPYEIDAFVGRGGSACTQPGGLTKIDQKLFDDTVAAVGGSEHPAKLGVMIAWTFAQKYGKEAFTLNPTNVDEYCDYARLTGIKGIYRVSHSHVLNQKAVAAYHAGKLGKKYEDCNFIVAHIDGGITVSAHDHGRMVDGNMGSIDEVRLACARSGGFVQYFGTSNSDTIHELVDRGDKKAVLIWNTMIYQICKMIGEMSTVLCGKVDGILLTGGLMRFQDIGETIEKRCGFIAPISVYPGEMEQEALALPALEALRGERTAMKYSGQNVWDGFDFLNEK